MKKLLILFILPFLFSYCVQQQSQDKVEIPITTSSDEAKQLFVKGRELSENLKSPQAAELFDKAIEKDLNFAKAYLYRAYSGGGYKFYRGNLSKAVELIDKISEGEKHEILYAEANADGDGQKQKAELDKLLELFPEDKRVQNTAGNYFYYTVQDYDKALIHYKKVNELDPNYASTYNSMGYMYKDIGNMAEAEKAFQKYIELIPDEANPYDSYAEFLMLQGRHSESIEQYNKSFEIDPEFVSALSGVGDNYIFMAEYDKAREYYQQYFDKAFNLNQKMGALSLKATSYVHEGNIEEAIKTLEERVTLANENNSPNYVVFSYLRSEFVLTEVDRFDEGAAYLDKVDDFIKTADIKEADRSTFKLIAGLDRCYYYIMKGDLKSAESDIKNHKQTVEQRKNPDEKKFLNLIFGMLETGKKNYESALTYLAEADKESPYVWFWQAVAQEKNGNIEEAKKLYSKVGTYNENGMGLAVVRKKAQDKAKIL